MKPGDLVRFVRQQVNIERTALHLRQDAVGIIIKKVRHLPDSWIVHFPAMGGIDGYPGGWLEIIDENTKR